MAEIIRDDHESDRVVQQLKAALDRYEREHPGAAASLYRYNPGSVRVRIVDRRFEPLNRAQRHDQTWRDLASHAGEDAMSEVSLLLLLPPHETSNDLMNLEFERPSPSLL